MRGKAFEDGPARPAQLLRVEWVARPDRSGRSRLEGSVRNAYGLTGERNRVKRRESS